MERWFILWIPWILYLQGFQTRPLGSNIGRKLREDELHWKDYLPRQNANHNISDSNDLYLPDYQEDFGADSNRNKLPEDSKHEYYYPHFEQYQYSDGREEQAEQGQTVLQNSLYQSDGQTALSSWANYFPNHEFRGKGNPGVLPSWYKPKELSSNGDSESKLTEGVSNYKSYPTYESQLDYDNRDNSNLPLEDDKIERIWKDSVELPIRQNQVSVMVGSTAGNEVSGTEVFPSRTPNQEVQSSLTRLLKTKPTSKKISLETTTAMGVIIERKSTKYIRSVSSPSSNDAGESFTRKTNGTFFEVSGRVSNTKSDDSSSIMKSLLMLFEKNKSLFNETLNQFFKFDESKKSMIKIKSKQVKDGDGRLTDTLNKEEPKDKEHDEEKKSFTLPGVGGDVQPCHSPNCEGGHSHLIQIRNIHTDQDSSASRVHLSDPWVLMLFAFNGAFFVLAVVLLKIAVHFTRSKLRMCSNTKGETNSEFGLDLELYNTSNRREQGHAGPKKSSMQKLNDSDVFSIE